MISDETIQRVRDQASIEAVVGDRVKLQRRGPSLIGLCPFHKEKTPSFHVNAEKGFYYCFGCHASGDAIKFIQETEGLNFAETIRELAGQIGIEIEETRSQSERREQDEVRRRREELYAVNQAAATFYQQCLKSHPLRQLALAELERRHLPHDSPDPQIQDALQAFFVGYAPYEWDGLVKHLTRAGLGIKAAEHAGLLMPRRTGGGHYDRFRHRLMFAVTDLRGRVVAFSGRSLEEPEQDVLAANKLAPLSTKSDDRVAKYMNSPESPVFKKRELVFGLFQAREAVRRNDECILVEGNFDVLSLHARGIRNVAAPLGTAFTEEQAAQIKRYTPNVTLLFDADSAGQRASRAARAPARSQGLRARVAQLPANQDPDDLIRAGGPDAVIACIRRARGMLEYLIDNALDSGFSAADPETQGLKVQQVVQLITEEEDPTMRTLAKTHADKVASRLDIRGAASLRALERAIRGASVPQNTKVEELQPPERARSEVRAKAVEEAVLGALVEHPQLLADEHVKKFLPHVTGELALSIASLAQAAPQFATQLHQLNDNLARIVASHLAAPKFGAEDVAREALLTNLKKVWEADRKRTKADAVDLQRQAASTGDFATEMELLKQLQERVANRRLE